MKRLIVSKFSGFKVAHKIFGLVGFLIAANVLVVGVILFQLNTVKTEVEEIATEHMPLTEITTQITVHQLEQAIHFERALRLGEQLEAVPEAAKNFKKEQHKFAELGHKVEKEVKQAEKLAESVIQHTSNAAVKEEYEKLLKGFKHFETAHGTYESHVKHLFKAVQAGNMDVHAIEQAAHKIEAEEDKLDHEIAAILKEVEAFTGRSLETVNEHEQQAFFSGLILALAAVLISTPLAVFIVRGVVRPLREVVAALGSLGEGDVSQTVEVKTQDEIGDTAKAYEALRQNTIEAQKLAEQQRQEEEAKHRRAQAVETLTSEFDTSVQEVLQAVDAATAQLEESASSMAAVAEETNQKSVSVASSSQQATANVQTVATATEEMEASIKEISEQVMQSANISKEAVGQAQSTNESVQALEQSAAQIGEVVQLIADIAEQTNLLALNATIEAARAGEAGKGFAVVASEVKELAEQTGKATENISLQIETIQSGTSGAVAAIQHIGATISKMDEIASAIAAAIEEQATTTGEIAQNVQQAAQGTQETMEAISEVQTATEDSGRVASDVLGASKELASRSEALRGNVDSFLNGIKAA
ncbi:MAG: methyl-accepting chemotaxis protein [Methyloligellaceae bacterium]